MNGGLDLARFHVVADENKTFRYHSMKVDRFLVQLTTSKHCPMVIDDLRGSDALPLDVGKDLAYRVWRRLIGSDHHLKRMGVADHRAEGLTDLMCNRAGQRRHRLT